MKVKIYCMYDSVADSYGDVFSSVNDNTAKRSFMGILQANPYEAKDIILYNVGEYDRDTGILTVIDKKVVCLGSDVVDGVKGEVLDNE